jgi:hypothetical protein
MDQFPTACCGACYRLSRGGHSLEVERDRYRGEGFLGLLDASADLLESRTGGASLQKAEPRSQRHTGSSSVSRKTSTSSWTVMP